MTINDDQDVTHPSLLVTVTPASLQYNANYTSYHALRLKVKVIDFLQTGTIFVHTKRPPDYYVTFGSFYLKGIRFAVVCVRWTFGQFAFVSDSVEHIAPKMDTEFYLKMIQYMLGMKQLI